MSDIRKYVALVETSFRSPLNESLTESIDDSDDYLFSYAAERLYESSGISLTILTENRIQWLRDNIMHKLEPLADKEGKTVEELFQWVVSQDPTKKKQYSQWLFKILVGKNAQSSFSDLGQAQATLTYYEDLKNAKQLNPEHKDLNRFKSIDELKKAISDTEQRVKTERDTTEQKARDESEIIHEDNVWLVTIPKTEYAAGYWGRETEWCTAYGFEGSTYEDRDGNMFDHYNKDDNIYTIYNKKNHHKHYQLHFKSRQFTDYEDNRIEKDILRSILNSFPKLRTRIMGNIGSDPKKAIDFVLSVDTATPELEDLIATNAKYSYEYANDVIHGRFEQGEKEIFKDIALTKDYAVKVVKDRIPDAEPIIATYPEYALRYITELNMTDRFHELELELGAKTAPKEIVNRYLKHYMLDDNASPDNIIDMLSTMNIKKNFNWLGWDIYEALLKFLYLHSDGKDKVLSYMKEEYLSTFTDESTTWIIPRPKDKILIDLLVAHYSDDSRFINKLVSEKFYDEVYEWLPEELLNKVMLLKMDAIKDHDFNEVFQLNKVTTHGIDIYYADHKAGDLIDTLSIVLGNPKVNSTTKDTVVDMTDELDDILLNSITDLNIVVLRDRLVNILEYGLFPLSKEFIRDKTEEYSSTIESVLYDDKTEKFKNIDEDTIETLSRILNNIHDQASKLN